MGALILIGLAALGIGYAVSSGKEEENPAPKAPPKAPPKAKAEDKPKAPAPDKPKDAVVAEPAAPVKAMDPKAQDAIQKIMLELKGKGASYESIKLENGSIVVHAGKGNTNPALDEISAIVDGFAVQVVE